jgi:hypothetical protein
MRTKENKGQTKIIVVYGHLNYLGEGHETSDVVRDWTCTARPVLKWIHCTTERVVKKIEFFFLSLCVPLSVTLPSWGQNYFFSPRVCFFWRTLNLHRLSNRFRTLNRVSRETRESPEEHNINHTQTARRSKKNDWRPDKTQDRLGCDSRCEKRIGRWITRSQAKTPGRYTTTPRRTQSNLERKDKKK